MGDYRLSPYWVCTQIGNPLLYDENTCSFYTADAWDLYLIPFQDKRSGDLPDIRNMDADLLYMGLAPNDKAWALMKKKTENLHFLLTMKATNRTPFSYPVLDCDTLRNDLELLQANQIASSKRNNIFYYVKGNRLYSCNVEGGFAEQEQWTLPEGEQVTFMRYLVFENYQAPAENFDCFCVATFDGENYKVYRFAVQAGNLSPNPEILEGKGKVGGVMYIDGTEYTNFW